MKEHAVIAERRGRRRPARFSNVPAHPQGSRRKTRLPLLLGASLAIATLGVYLQTVRFDFVAYDDDTFVYQNPVVAAGLKGSGILWSFGLHFANWHPLTWLSYLLDSQLFGMNPGGFHLVNVLLHTTSVVLLFLALLRMTRMPWRSVFIAAVFALHPLHVESVAWVAERKDVLSTCLEMAALLIYLRYVERPTLKRYVPLFLTFGLSLMAKPMLVTFPIILLLLDFWPLHRIEWPFRWAGQRRVILEKAPLLLASLAASVLTVIAQRDYGTVASLASTPVWTRIATAATAYLVYIRQSVWPTHLAVLYPVAPITAGVAVICIAILLAITAAVVMNAVRRPYWFTGWFWYLVMLAPVIGLIQVGAQSRADRYMYVPLVGLTIAAVWTAGDWLERNPNFKLEFAAAAGVLLVALAAGTWYQIGYWQDSRTLFEHTIAVTDGNYIMHNNLGVVLARSGDEKGALAEYRQAMAINSDYAEAKGNVGNSLLRAGKLAEARPLLESAVRLKPDFPMALLDLGIVEANAGSYADSITHLTEAMRLTPQDPEVHSNLCYSLEHAGRLQDALAQCREALKLRPNYPDALFNWRSVEMELHQQPQGR